nr:zinc finger, CCHC-type [Tanacetum cinerariifolium]
MTGDDTTNTLKPVTPIAQYECPKLKATNYTVWVIQIKVILEAHDLWEAIEPKKNTQVDDKKDKVTIAFLYQALTEDVILQVVGCETSKELWESLRRRYVGEEKVQQARLQSLIIGFQTLQMKEDDTVDAFTAKLNGYATKAKEFGKTLDESLLVRKLFDSTPDRGTSITQEQSNLILEDDEPSLLMTAHETKHEEVRLNEGQIQPGKYPSADASIWYLENGASNHMMGTKNHFRDINESITGQICDACLLGKHSRKPFPNQAKFRSKNPLDLVYGDLCGPISPATLVDDCTRFMWAYLLTSKDQTFSTFKEFRQRMEMEIRMKLRMLRTYRGGEFTSNEFIKYYKENEIAQQLTAPYSPQQNEVVERRNRTVLSTTRSMIKEEVYFIQPEGFIQQRNFGKVYKLTKALYGLRQALRAWNTKLDQILLSLDFKKCNLEQGVYTKRSKTFTLIVEVYVDDLIITGTPRKELEIPMDPDTKLVKAKDGNSVDATYYKSLIGSLSDSSYGINTNQRKGTTGIVFYFGESPIIWCTQQQPTVVLSSCELESMVATGAACQALWLKRILSELTGWEEKRITLKVHNISAIALVRNPIFHGRSKHIDIHYHFIRECIENGHINVEHVSRELQRAYILTKALPRLKFVTMRQMLALQNLGRSNDQD